MSTYEITINLDIKCSKCGKGGAIAQNKAGLCMECIRKIMAKKLKKDRRLNSIVK